MPNDSHQATIDSLHSAACERGEMYYTDPESGYIVFTALELQANGQCCGCGCRHCPYGHEMVPDAAKDGLVTDPWFVAADSDAGGEPGAPTDVLFWSGGKDSFLALRRLQQAGLRDVTLLTTYDGRSGRVAHQDVHIDLVRDQAEALGLSHMLVPVFPELDYTDRVLLSLRQLRRHRQVKRLAFGDLHLEGIRQWRVDNFAERLKPDGIELCFPVWQAPYDQLTDELFSQHATYTVSAITSDACAAILEVGESFTREKQAMLPPEVDAFGENGEFHTLVVLQR